MNPKPDQPQIHVGTGCKSSPGTGPLLLAIEVSQIHAFPNQEISGRMGLEWRRTDQVGFRDFGRDTDGDPVYLVFYG
jgi:hypothetical protein